MGAVEVDLLVLRSFTAGLRRDLDARGRRADPWNTTPAPSRDVNRIKQLKSALYGRTKPDLLCKLILLA